jgi:hypothetical protein
MASIGFLIVAAACCSVIFLGPSSILWLALGLLIASMGVLYVGVRVTFGGLRKLLRALREGAASEGENAAAIDNEVDGDDTLATAAGFAIASGIYLLVFFPLTLWIAISHGTPLADALLMIDVTGAASGLGVLDRIRLLVSDPAFYLPAGVLYSAGGMVSLFFLSLRAKPILETSSMVFGLTVGYTSALFVAHLAGNQLHPTLFTPGLGMVYVFLLHYAMVTIAEYVPMWGMRAKYSHLLDGLESIGTAFILSRIYGLEAAVFGGVVFFVCTFLGASLWESTVGRLMKQLATVLDRRSLLGAWREWRQLPRGDQRKARRRAMRRMVLVSSLTTTAMPLFAYLCLRLFCGP